MEKPKHGLVSLVQRETSTSSSLTGPAHLRTGRPACHHAAVNALPHLQNSKPGSTFHQSSFESRSLSRWKEAQGDREACDCAQLEQLTSCSRSEKCSPDVRRRHSRISTSHSSGWTASRAGELPSSQLMMHTRGLFIPQLFQTRE